MMLARQPVEGERLLDRFLDPCDEPRITRAPFGDPGGEVVAGLFDRAAVVKPAQLLQAVVVGLARQVIEGVAAGSGRSSAGTRHVGQDLADGRAQACMIVGDDQLDAIEAAFGAPMRKSFHDERRLSRLAISTARIWRKSVPVDADGDQHRLAHHHAALAHLLVARVEDEVGKGSSRGRPAKASRLSSRRLLMIAEMAEAEKE